MQGDTNYFDGQILKRLDFIDKAFKMLNGNPGIRNVYIIMQNAPSK